MTGDASAHHEGQIAWYSEDLTSVMQQNLTILFYLLGAGSAGQLVGVEAADDPRGGQIDVLSDLWATRG